MADETNTVFAARLGALLEAKGAKNVDLARYLNVTKSTVSKYLRGRIPNDTNILLGIARFVGGSVDYLLGRVDDPKSSMEVVTQTSELHVGVDLTNPEIDLVYFLRGRDLTDDDIQAIKDLMEARKLRREREARDKNPS